MRLVVVSRTVASAAAELIGPKSGASVGRAAAWAESTPAGWQAQAAAPVAPDLVRVERQYLVGGEENRVHSASRANTPA